MSWEIFNDDAFSLLGSLAQVDHVICDPPYSEWTHSKSRRGDDAPDGFSRDRDLGFAALTETQMQMLAFHAARLARRWVMFFCDLESLGDWKRALEGAGLDYVRGMVWVKDGCTPQFTGDRPAAGAEAIALAHQPGRKRWNGGGLRGVFQFPIVTGASGERTEHTTQKSERLMMRLVELFTDSGDRILDPTCGSGSTGVAALRLGRNFTGIEANAAYAQLSRVRLTAEENGSTLRALRKGQAPLFPAATLKGADHVDEGGSGTDRE